MSAQTTTSDHRCIQKRIRNRMLKRHPLPSGTRRLWLFHTKSPHTFYHGSSQATQQVLTKTGLSSGFHAKLIGGVENTLWAAYIYGEGIGVALNSTLFSDEVFLQAHDIDPNCLVSIMDAIITPKAKILAESVIHATGVSSHVVNELQLQGQRSITQFHSNASMISPEWRITV